MLILNTSVESVIRSAWGHRLDPETGMKYHIRGGLPSGDLERLMITDTQDHCRQTTLEPSEEQTTLKTSEQQTTLKTSEGQTTPKTSVVDVVPVH